MSLYKVLSKSGLMTQEVKAAASGGGSFVWGKEGFKWIEELLREARLMLLLRRRLMMTMKLLSEITGVQATETLAPTLETKHTSDNQNMKCIILCNHHSFIDASYLIIV